MRLTSIGCLAIAASSDFAGALQAIANPARQEKYVSGEVMSTIMMGKLASWESQKAAGLMDSSLYRSFAGDGPVPCVDGFAEVIPGDGNNTFRCSNMDFYDFKSHADLGSATGSGASIWGWTSTDGREFVAIAQEDGAALAEISSVGKLIYLGRLPRFPGASPSIWREIRGYKNFVVIGSEASRHGVQIFDMSKLLDIDPASPITFDGRADLTGHFNGLPVGSTHNVVVNEERNYAVAVGAVPRNGACASGLIFIDLADPANPTTPGCAAGDGYVHDAQCLVYRGPDTEFLERDICYGYNEDTLTIYDVTDKTAPTIISRTGYTGASYVHQGWVTDTQWQTRLLLDDEWDEEKQNGEGAEQYPVTYFWDISSLAAPKLTGFFRNEHGKGIDHNQFVIDGFAYQSNYGGGLHVLDVTSLEADPTGAGVSLAAFFDIYPEDDALPGRGVVDYVGTWGHYPFFKSGFIVVNTIERGAFVVKRTA
ncbi:unnamed protein product [Discula destructiva]